MKKIAKYSLEELSKVMPTLSEKEQTGYVGGGSGTINDPYWVVEMDVMINNGSWTGGYVQGMGYVPASAGSYSYYSGYNAGSFYHEPNLNEPYVRPLADYSYDEYCQYLKNTKKYDMILTGARVLNSIIFPNNEDYIAVINGHSAFQGDLYILADGSKTPFVSEVPNYYEVNYANINLYYSALVEYSKIQPIEISFFSKSIFDSNSNSN